MATLTTIDEKTGEEKTADVGDWKALSVMTDAELKALSETNYYRCQFLCTVNKRSHFARYTGKVFLNNARNLSIDFTLSEDEFHLIQLNRELKNGVPNTNLVFNIPVIVRLFKGTAVRYGKTREYVGYEILPAVKVRTLVKRGFFDRNKLIVLHQVDPYNSLHIVDRGAKELPSEFAGLDVSGETAEADAEANPAEA